MHLSALASNTGNAKANSSALSPLATPYDHYITVATKCRYFATTIFALCRIESTAIAKAIEIGAKAVYA
jgi:hypothetical protein